jgi:hypothetical protein
MLGLTRPAAKYANGTKPTELISTTAVAQRAFEPRTSSAGRRARSMSAATFNTASNPAPIMISR